MELIKDINKKVLDWLDERYNARQWIRDNLTEKLVHKHINWLYCFGGLSFLGFLLQIGTGIFLMMYYMPTPKDALASVQNITNNVPFGWLFQRLHSVGANVVNLLVIFHMLRVLYHGAYKKPREFQWVSGVFLLLITMAMSFTGYLLPWTQLSYWGATIGTEMPGATPIVGEWLVQLIRGGAQITGITLTRFYAIHVVVLPLTLIGFLGVHFLMIRKVGISGPM